MQLKHYDADALPFDEGPCPFYDFGIESFHVDEEKVKIVEPTRRIVVSKHIVHTKSGNGNSTAFGARCVDA
jgi:hypothetical protein